MWSEYVLYAYSCVSETIRNIRMTKVIMFERFIIHLLISHFDKIVLCSLIKVGIGFFTLLHKT